VIGFGNSSFVRETAMNRESNRRQFLRTTGAMGAGLGLLGSGLRLAAAADLPAKGAPHAEQLGWRLGCSSYCFQLFSLFEAIEKTASLGLKYIDIYTGQKLGGKYGDVVVSPEMAKEHEAALRKKLADHGLSVPNYATMDYPKSETEWRKLFAWLKQMGIETFITEPPEDVLENVDKLCNEYQINLAIHNHPKPSHYWNPDTVLRVVKDRSRRIGACADTGHWKRSGFAPVECLRKLEGRVICFHFKDLVKEGDNYHDVPWGTGQCNVRGMLEEVHRQRLKAVFAFEYEYHWENSLPEIAKSVAYFDRVAGEISRKPATAAP
jgi:sugar phosphate isomerase/epimerase